MVRSESGLLSSDMTAVCGTCCETIWLYPRPNGDKVALDDGLGLGPFLIAGGNVYELPGARGYRRHADSCTGSCKSAEGSLLTSHVTDDDFLWP
jgi:hypothetical protein